VKIESVKRRRNNITIVRWVGEEQGAIYVELLRVVGDKRGSCCPAPDPPADAPNLPPLKITGQKLKLGWQVRKVFRPNRQRSRVRIQGHDNLSKVFRRFCFVRDNIRVVVKVWMSKLRDR